MLRAVLLDVNGTLTDPSAIGVAWGRPDLGEQALQHAISTAMVAALLGDGERAFSDHLSAAVDVVAAAADLDPGGNAKAIVAAHAFVGQRVEDPRLRYAHPIIAPCSYVSASETPT
jgi:hypothetical protein